MLVRELLRQFGLEHKSESLLWFRLKFGDLLLSFGLFAFPTNSILEERAAHNLSCYRRACHLAATLHPGAARGKEDRGIVSLLGQTAYAAKDYL
jgi:hypothetical protein